jgi:hypothetical protein
MVRSTRTRVACSETAPATTANSRRVLKQAAADEESSGSDSEYCCFARCFGSQIHSDVQILECRKSLSIELQADAVDGGAACCWRPRQRHHRLAIWTFIQQETSNSNRARPYIPSPCHRRHGSGRCDEHGSRTCSAAPQHAVASKPANGSRIPPPHQLFSRISETFSGQRYRINNRQGLV